MPTFRIPMPDGRTAVVEASHGATREQAAIAALQAYRGLHEAPQRPMTPALQTSRSLNTGLGATIGGTNAVLMGQ